MRYQPKPAGWVLAQDYSMAAHLRVTVAPDNALELVCGADTTNPFNRFRTLRALAIVGQGANALNSRPNLIALKLTRALTNVVCQGPADRQHRLCALMWSYA